MYSFNEKFFHNIDTEDTAYVLGFVCTDGNIYKRDGYQFQLGISVRDYDKEILFHFKDSLNSNHPIHEQSDARRPTTIMNSIVFVSDKMGEDLGLLKIYPNKTFNLDYNFIFNQLNRELWPAFILGLFDGDGNIDCPKNGTISRSHVRLSGPIKELQQINQQLSLIGLNSNLATDKRKYTQPFGSLECINTTDKYCLLKYMYSANVNGLSRKRQEAYELMRRIEYNVTNRAENKMAIETWRRLK